MSKQQDALEEPQQEPVAELVVSQYSGGKRLDIEWNLAADAMAFNLGRLPLYTHPAQHTWVGLTDGEIFKAIRPLYRDDITALAAIRIAKDEYRAIEAAHGIKEST